MSGRRESLQLDELNAIQKRFQRVFVLMGLLSIGLVVLIILRTGSDTPPNVSERVTLWSTVLLATVMLTSHYQCLRRTGKESRERIEKLTFMDALTGTHNHRYLEMVLASEFRRAKRHHRPMCLAYIDLDHFKPVNDKLGHAVGNRVLADLGHIFTASARGSDVVGRVGGDEFLVVLPETDLTGAQMFSERVRLRVEAYSFEVSPEVKADGVTCSIGVVELTAGSDIEEVEEFKHRADAAMYRAKRAGGNRVST